MKWRESLIVVAFIVASLVLINLPSGDEPASTEVSTTAEVEPTKNNSLVRQDLEEVPALVRVERTANPPAAEPENLFGFPEDINVPAIPDFPVEYREMIRNNPTVAADVEAGIARSHESQMVGVRMALDALELDQAVHDNVLEEIDLSQDALLAAKIAEARGDITLQEYVETLSTISPSAIAGRYLTDLQMIEFAELMRADEARQNAEFLDELNTRFGIDN